ncbi:MAG: hypothetical protein WCO68_09480 [Verrucomicrobiota bacterium]
MAKKKTHAKIASFGCATTLWGKGLSVRVEMEWGDIERIIEALSEHLEEKGDIKRKAAADTLLSMPLTSRGSFHVTADVVIAGHGVYLDPIMLVTSENGKQLQTISGHGFPENKGHGMEWVEPKKTKAKPTSLKLR